MLNRRRGGKKTENSNNSGRMGGKIANQKEKIEKRRKLKKRGRKDSWWRVSQTRRQRIRLGRGPGR